jgi:hypothetical protein
MKKKRIFPGDIQDKRLRAAMTPAPGLRLGDKVHAILGSIGRAIHWPCMKGDGTTDLKPKSLCGYLRQTLNNI